jgi:hypothetical protein
MDWILLITLLGHQGDASLGMTFSTREQCVMAAQQVHYEVYHDKVLSHKWTSVETTCIEEKTYEMDKAIGKNTKPGHANTRTEEK